MKYVENVTAAAYSFPAGVVPSGLTPVFFDIETTGFSKRGCPVYLIGELIPDERTDTVCFRQWFSECPDEEPEVLKAFLSSLPENAFLCHFNGANFDIPFIRARCALHGIGPEMLRSFPEDTGLDFYRSLQPVSSLLPMGGRSQKEYEKLSGFRRTDPYDGGLLITFYREYVGPARLEPERAEVLLSSMLLHNRDDLFGLYSLLSLLPLALLLTDRLPENPGVLESTCETEPLPVSPASGNASVPSPEAGNTPEQGVVSGHFLIRIPLFAPLPSPVLGSYRRSLTGPKEEETLPGELTLTLTENAAVLSVPLLSGSYRYYFPNYRDYYYLPKEDRVIHKSIAETMEKSARVRAKREQACIAYTGTFLPLTGPEFGRVFRTSATAPTVLTEYKEPVSPVLLIPYTGKLLARFSKTE